MGAQIISAEKRADGYHLRVHLDTDAVVTEEEAEGLGLEVGAAHPDYLREWVWGHPHDQHQGMTEEQYVESIRLMVADMARTELRALRGTCPQPTPPERVDSLHGKAL